MRGRISESKGYIPTQRLCSTTVFTLALSRARPVQAFRELLF